MRDYLRTDDQMERKLLEYIGSTAQESEYWWGAKIPGTTETRKTRLENYRLRYDARRSVAQLMSDIKTEPYLRASNVGVGLEQIFGEWLVANCLANTVDLDPCLDVYDPKTRGTNEIVREFYNDKYLHEIDIRSTYEQLTREIFTVGGAISKWESCYDSRQREKVQYVLVDPISKQPILDPATGEYIAADPKTPMEELPTDPLGNRLKVGPVTEVERVNKGWIPKLRVRTVEQISVPPTAITQDPDTWDYIHETYVVNAWWFLGREGEMYEGRIPKERLDKLWQVLGVRPDEAWRKPDGKLVQPVEVRESHMKFPASKSGKPVEIVVTSLPKYKFVLSWRITPFQRRPYFNHRVWSRVNHWMGKGIPETIFGMRNALDALLNQDLDAGNLFNQPPLLISSLAGINDETFEMAGPGAVWYLRDINGIKFLPPPIRSRDPIAMMNWLVSMAQRLWGVTDLNLNAPTSSLSPNISTAHATERVIQQGNIKFSHLIRSINSVRTQELKMMHQEFSERWTGQYQTADTKGQQVTLSRQNLDPSLKLTAVGDGILTNPDLRQQRLMQVMTFHMQTQNPIVVGDPDVLYDATQQINDAAGIKLPIKEMQQMQEMKLAHQLMQTPTGQAAAPQAMQELQLALAIQQQQQQAQGGKNAQPV